MKVLAQKNINITFLEILLKTCLMQKHFNKSLIMTGDEEENFQSSNTWWICEKRIENDDENLHKKVIAT